MKTRLFLLSFIIAIFTFAFSSCEKTPTETPTTYSDVSNILSSNCAVSGCHDATTAQNNVVCTSYATLSGATGGYTNILHTNSNGFHDRVLVQQNMPPSGLSQENRDLLQKWVDNNYAEN